MDHREEAEEIQFFTADPSHITEGFKKCVKDFKKKLPNADIIHIIVIAEYLKTGPRFNEVFLKHIIQRWVKLFKYICNEQRSPQRKTIFQMCTEELVIEGCDLDKRSEFP